MFWGEFFHWKGAQALAGAAQGGLGCPSLEVSKEFLGMAPSWAELISHRWDPMTPKGFSNLHDPIL